MAFTGGNEVAHSPTKPDTRLPFTARVLLAPMEGVTDPAFRDVVLARHSPSDLGGAFTEFVRVTQRPASLAQLDRHLGRARFEMPVGVQLMGSDTEVLRGSAARAVEAGAPLVDLNFGCPAKGALRGCAGSALLGDPRQIERFVKCCVDGVDGRVPVTAKIRAGIDHADDVEVLARAAEAGGASMLTIHCRTRTEGYRDPVDWTRIERAVSAVEIPVCGNGGVNTHADIARMRDSTGCAFVMIGRAALADPWIFAGRRASRDEAVAFLREYTDNLRGARAGTPEGVNARLKQMFNYWTAGDLIPEGERHAWLRDPDPVRRLDVDSAPHDSTALNPS